jgi:sulfur-oxidizing protein SoxY
MKRRTLLKGTVAAGIAASAGMLIPKQVLAKWPKAAFEAKDVTAAITGVAGSGEMSDSSDIAIKAPDIAENGAVVPVSITSGISGTETISIIAEKNGNPLAASFNLGKGAEGFVSTRIKMGKTSDVIAVVKANGKLYSAKKEVKVTIGGCGG